jgi:acetolactate decarboxylase
MDKQVDAPVQSQSWCVEWFGSQGDFIAGKAKEPISLSRFGGLESLYAIGPLERGRGEVSIYDSVPLISEVHDSRTNVSVDFSRRAAFLVYAIVENWRRVTLRKLIDGEQQLEEQLLPFAVESGIDVDLPFPFLIHCHITQATFHVLRNQSDGEYSPEVHEKAKVRFPIIDQSVEIIGFYSRRHRGVFTPRDSDFHMHVRTLDNQLSGHLESFSFSQGMVLYLPTDES